MLKKESKNGHGRVVMGVAKSLFSSGDSSCPPSPSRTQTALHCVCVYVCVSRACVHGGVRACVRACVCVCVCSGSQIIA